MEEQNPAQPDPSGAQQSEQTGQDSGLQTPQPDQPVDPVLPYGTETEGETPAPDKTLEQPDGVTEQPNDIPADAQPTPHVDTEPPVPGPEQDPGPTPEPNPDANAEDEPGDDEAEQGLEEHVTITEEVDITVDEVDQEDPNLSDHAEG